MLFPRVKIRRVASASLVLSGAFAGCGDGDSNASVAARQCRHARDCAPDDFAVYYGDDLQECVEARETGFAQVETRYGAECARALRGFISCYLAVDRGMCMDGEDLYDACVDEFEAYYDACYTY